MGEVEIEVDIKANVDEAAFNKSVEQIQALQAGAEAFARNWKDQCIACRESLKEFDAAFARVIEAADHD